MAEPVDALVPDDARWWLAQEGCGALVWDGDSGTMLGANAVVLRLLGRDVARWRPGDESVRDAFGITYGSGWADLAEALGSRAPRVRRLARTGADDIRLLLVTWRMGSVGAGVGNPVPRTRCGDGQGRSSVMPPRHTWSCSTSAAR